MENGPLKLKKAEPAGELTVPGRYISWIGVA